jgi:hypothetical protein
MAVRYPDLNHGAHSSKIPKILGVLAHSDGAQLVWVLVTYTILLARARRDANYARHNHFLGSNS